MVSDCAAAAAERRLESARCRLLCFHDISEQFQAGGQILPEDIYLFWWYDCSKVGTVVATRLPVPKTILEPTIVRGKGRLKGSKGISSKGNSKNDGVTGMF
jgi:hypothetical protein